MLLVLLAGVTSHSLSEYILFVLIADTDLWFTTLGGKYPRLDVHQQDQRHTRHHQKGDTISYIASPISLHVSKINTLPSATAIPLSLEDSPFAVSVFCTQTEQSPTPLIIACNNW